MRRPWKSGPPPENLSVLEGEERKPVMEIQVGDVVKLKSGGPEITISEVAWDANVLKAKCLWFVEAEANRVRFSRSTF
jgi:uncharacterized protein YodC (DUF2158 family)